MYLFIVHTAGPSGKQTNDFEPVLIQERNRFITPFRFKGCIGMLANNADAIPDWVAYILVVGLPISFLAIVAMPFLSVLNMGLVTFAAVTPAILLPRSQRSLAYVLAPTVYLTLAYLTSVVLPGDLDHTFGLLILQALQGGLIVVAVRLPKRWRKRTPDLASVLTVVFYLGVVFVSNMILFCIGSAGSAQP